MSLSIKGVWIGLAGLLWIGNAAWGQSFTSPFGVTSSDPVARYYYGLGYYQVDPARPHIFAYNNALYYRDINDSLQPLTLEPDGRITYGSARTYYPHVDQQVYDMYASLRGTSRWNVMAQRLNQSEGGTQILTKIRTAAANPISSPPAVSTPQAAPGEWNRSQPTRTPEAAVDSTSPTAIKSRPHSAEREVGKRPLGQAKEMEPPIPTKGNNEVFNALVDEFNNKTRKKLHGIANEDRVTETSLKCTAKNDPAHNYEMKLTLTEACRLSQGKKEARLYFDMLETIDPSDKDRVIDAQDVASMAHFEEMENGYKSTDSDRHYQLRFADGHPSLYIAGTKNNMTDEWICVAKNEKPAEPKILAKKEPVLPSDKDATALFDNELEQIFRDGNAGVFLKGKDLALPFVCGGGHEDRSPFSNLKYLTQSPEGLYRLTNGGANDTRPFMKLGEQRGSHTVTLGENPEKNPDGAIIRRLHLFGKSKIVIMAKGGICVSQNEVPTQTELRMTALRKFFEDGTERKTHLGVTYRFFKDYRQRLQRGKYSTEQIKAVEEAVALIKRVASGGQATREEVIAVRDRYYDKLWNSGFYFDNELFRPFADLYDLSEPDPVIK